MHMQLRRIRTLLRIRPRIPSRHTATAAESVSGLDTVTTAAIAATTVDTADIMAAMVATPAVTAVITAAMVVTQLATADTRAVTVDTQVAITDIQVAITGIIELRHRSLRLSIDGKISVEV